MCEVLASSCYGSVRILSGSVGQVEIVGRRNTVIMLTIRGMIRVPVAFLPFLLQGLHLRHCWCV